MRQVKNLLKLSLLCATILGVVIALLTIGLRLTLPKLDHYKPQIESYLEDKTGLDFDFGKIDAKWQTLMPSLVLNDLSVDLKTKIPANLYAKQIELRLDLLGSLMDREVKVKDLVLSNVYFDASQLDVLADSDESTDVSKVLRRVQNIFFEQLANFSILDSNIKFMSLDGKVRDLEIEELLWRNLEQRHQAKGMISLADANLNQVRLIADLVDGKSKDSFGGKTLSGDVYLAASEVQALPWLPDEIQKNSGIESASLSFESWLSLKDNKMQSASLALQPSSLSWINPKTQQRQSFAIEKGLIDIQPQGLTQKTDLYTSPWKINATGFQIKTDTQEWPNLSWQLYGQDKDWLLNINQLQIQDVTPLVSILPAAQDYVAPLQDISPEGSIKDIRFRYQKQHLDYSFDLDDVKANQYQSAPGVNNLSARVTGTEKSAQVFIALEDSVMPFGGTFLEPIKVDHAAIELALTKTEQGLTLTLPKVDLKTPEINVLGEIAVQFKKGHPPFLSMYAETDLMDIGEIWRYLPAKVISPYMMNYLSTSIQGGYANTAKLVWSGDLSEYPYKEKQGIFEASIPLQDTRYAFLTTWPAIEDAQLDLNFINDALYFSSKHAKTMDVTATSLEAVIPHLNGQGHIELQAKLEGEGQAVRQYMAASPLVETVGAALNTVQVDGLVKAGLNLNIPFNNKESKVAGYALLDGNPIHVTKPDMQFSDVKGRIDFLNDVVTAKKLNATWLNQPVVIAFNGKKTAKGYQVKLNNKATWDLVKLQKTVPEPWLKPLKGDMPWELDFDLLMRDVGMQYQINTKADLNRVQSNFPSPLGLASGNKQKGGFSVKGDTQALDLNLDLPYLKYQARMDLTQDDLDITASRAVVGNGSFASSLPANGTHKLELNARELHLDPWISFLTSKKGPVSKAQTQKSLLDLPAPNQFEARLGHLNVANTNWYKVNLDAKPTAQGWEFNADSQELKGVALWRNREPNNQLDINLTRLHINLPEDKASQTPKPSRYPGLTQEERRLFEFFPNLNLTIKALWLQGYRLGNLEMHVAREQNRLDWKKLELTTGSNRLEAKGYWQVNGDHTNSNFNFRIAGDNNSELMERFGLSSGLQKAKFNLDAQLRWQGTPWSMDVPSLNGNLSTKFSDGVITGVNNGAVKLLGIFSLDSIMRKMRLDFTGVFDDGLAFKSISGTGKISKGIFVTNDIEMEAVAGDMSLKGRADLYKRLVDAEVTFVPDLTSSIPVLAAFAVTPPTAVAVFAITKLLNPVVDVITKVEYGVKGPFDSPKVTELSRTKGEYKLQDEVQAKN